MFFYFLSLIEIKSRCLFIKMFLRKILKNFIQCYCDFCRQPLKLGENISCDSCLKAVQRKISWTRLQRQDLFMLELWSVFYSSLNFHKIHDQYPLLTNIKFLNKKQQLYWLLKLTTLKFTEKIDYITYVPISMRRHLLRGFNQSQLIAQFISKQLKIPLISCLKKKDNLRQSSKTRSQRIEMMQKHPFRLKKNKLILTDKTILIVDDILTTGATISICGKLLKEYHNCTLLGYTLFYTDFQNPYKDLFEKAVTANF